MFAEFDIRAELRQTMLAEHNIMWGILAMSYREKTAWAAIVGDLIVWGGYLLNLLRETADGSPELGDLIGLFTGAVIASVVIHVGLAIVVALVAPRAAEAPADERERLIELEASRLAYTVFSVAAVTVALAVPILAMGGPVWLDDALTEVALIAANGLILSLVAAEMLNAVARIVGYRRGV